MATYVTKKQAASRLGVSVKTIERRIKKGDLARTIVHGPHGPEVRVLLDDAPAVVDATFPVAPATKDVAPVEGFAPSSNGLDRSGEELATLALRALDEVAQENARLRALVAELRRPWWRRVGERLRRGR
jgi:hypothetical protein